MIRTEIATEESLQKFEYDGIEKEMLDKLNWREQLLAYHKMGRVWQVMNQSQNPIMVWGLFECSKGVLNAWMLFNRAAAFYTKSIAVDVKERLYHELKTFHRIQTYVYGGEKAGHFVSLMGAKKEATLKKFGPGQEDVMIYSMVRK